MSPTNDLSGDMVPSSEPLTHVISLVVIGCCVVSCFAIIVYILNFKFILRCLSEIWFSSLNILVAWCLTVPCGQWPLFATVPMVVVINYGFHYFSGARGQSLAILNKQNVDEFGLFKTIILFCCVLFPGMILGPLFWFNVNVQLKLTDWQFEQLFVEILGMAVVTVLDRTWPQVSRTLSSRVCYGLLESKCSCSVNRWRKCAFSHLRNKSNATHLVLSAVQCIENKAFGLSGLDPLASLVVLIGCHANVRSSIFIFGIGPIVGFILGLLVHKWINDDIEYRQLPQYSQSRWL